MDRPPNPAEEAAESVNLGDQRLSASDPYESIESESNSPTNPTEALLGYLKTWLGYWTD